MKEYSVTLTFAIEAAKKSEYEDISEFAEKLIDKILDNDDLIISNGIEVVDISLDNIEDYSTYEDDDDQDDELDED